MSLIPWIEQYFDGVADSIIVAGSLSYGADYSVTTDSDIDLLIILDDAAIDKLAEMDIYSCPDLERAISGYKSGLYQQFSLNADRDGVLVESHFWNKRAFIEAIDYTNSQTPRLRSSVATPSTDYGFSFDGTHDVLDLYGEMVDGYPVSPFPSYRVVDEKLYLCRPITNILGTPITLKTDADIDSAVNRCWLRTVEHFRLAKRASVSGDLSIVRALPSQYKMSPAAKETICLKTEQLL